MKCLISFDTSLLRSDQLTDLTDANNRKWVSFQPSKPTHGTRQDTNTDMLACSPSCVDRRDLDSCHTQFIDSAETSHCDSCLDKSKNAI